MAKKKQQQQEPQEKKKNQKEESEGLFKGVFMAYFVLVLHVLLIAGVACLILFFQSVLDYKVWILAGCLLLISALGYYFFRRMRDEGKALGETLNSPVFSGKTVEISFLGGLASLKMGTPGNNALAMGNGTFEPHRQLEDPSTLRIRKLKELAYLLENDLISREEYNQTKQQIFNS